MTKQLVRGGAARPVDYCRWLHSYVGTIVDSCIFLTNILVNRQPTDSVLVRWTEAMLMEWVEAFDEKTELHSHELAARCYVIAATEKMIALYAHHI